MCIRDRTGGTAEASAKLVKMSGGKVSGFIFVINLFDLGGSDNLIKNGYKVKNLIDFPGHWCAKFAVDINITLLTFI